MIQVYKPGTSLSRNGDMVLTPSECTVTAKLNEVWTLEMVHPIDPEGRWEYIVEEGVLKVPTWQDSDQLYRIASIEKTEDYVSVVAYPIFLDTRNRVFIDNLTVRGTAQTALNQMLALGPTDPDNPGTALFKASAYSSAVRSLNFAMRNFMDCLNGNDEPTITGMYGGEFEYDNFRLYLRDQIGTDNDVYVRYGKNITGIEYTVDYSEMITRIYPVAYGDYTISSGTRYVDSTHIGSYDMIYARMVVFDNIRMAADVRDDETDNYTICNSQSEMDTQLRNAAARMMADGADVPKVSIKIDMVSLADSDQYADISDFETIRLGDTVHCVHERLGVVSDTRAVGITWDCAKNRIKTIELGEFTFDYMREISGKIDAIANITNPDGSIMAERVRGFLDGTKTAIHILRTSATAAHVMAVLFEDKVPNSPTYGALGIGTKGLMIANEWDDNLNDWNWTTGITADGVNAEMGVFGLLADKLGRNYIDFDSGDARIGDDNSYILYDAETGVITIRASTISVGPSGTNVETAISAAQSTADGAQTAAENAALAAVDAQNAAATAEANGGKTATNYLFYSANQGLVVSETGDAYGSQDCPYNIQITSSAIKLRKRATALLALDANGYRIYDDNGQLRMDLGSSELAFYNANGVKKAFIGTNGLEVLQGKIGGFSADNTRLSAYYTDGWYLDNQDRWYIQLTNPTSLSSNVIEIKHERYFRRKQSGSDTYTESRTLQETTSYINISGDAKFDCLIAGNDDSTGFYPFINCTDSQSDSGFRLGSIESYDDKIEFYDVKATTMGSQLILDNMWEDGSIIMDGSFGLVCYNSSSSKRYKNYVEDMSLEYAKGILKITPIIFQYKDGYLIEGDECAGKDIPGFFAEDVEENFPMGVFHLKNGLVENWKPERIIPAMLRIMQDQQSHIDSLESKLSEACDRITRLENLVSSLMEGK